MSNLLFSRRDFSRTIGSLALAFAAPSLPLRLDDTGDLPASEKTIHLNFNENPYGPSPKALQALDSCGPVAARLRFPPSQRDVETAASKSAARRAEALAQAASADKDGQTSPNL